MHLIHGHVIALDPVTELCRLGQTDDGMPVSICRQLIDKVDHAILQTSDLQAVEYMNDQRT
jgi:hypothetical protein